MTHMRTRIFSILLTCAMIMSLLPATALAVGPAGTWADAVLEQPSTGYSVDTEEKTVTISTAEGLAWFAKQINSWETTKIDFKGYSINITEDIDLSAHLWIPIDPETVNSAGNSDRSETYNNKLLDGATINGNGNTITGMTVHNTVRGPAAGHADEHGAGQSCYYYAGFIGRSTGVLTIKNLTFEGASVDGKNEPSIDSQGSSSLAVVLGYNGSTLNCENVHVKNSVVTGYTKLGAFTGQDTGILNLTGCSVTGCSFLLEEFYVGQDYAVPMFAAAVSGFKTKYAPSLIDMTVSGNSFAIPEGMGESVTTSTGETVMVSYDSRYQDMNRFYTDTVFMGGYGGDTVDHEGVQCKVYGYDCGSVATASSTGDAVYSTLGAAIAAAESGDTVTLLKDTAESETISVAEGKTLTLDLNGHAVSVGAAGSGLENHGTLTINDSSAVSHGIGTGRIYTTDVEAQGRAAVTNYGTLVINGGIFGDKNTDQTDVNDVQRGNALRNYGDATVNGGAFTCCDNYTKGGYAYAIGNGSSSYPDAALTINYATAYGSVNGLIASDGGKVTVKDGSYKLGDGTENNLWRVVYTSGAGSVEINGGTYTKNTISNYGFFGDYGGGITVTDGIFEDIQEGNGIYVDEGTVAITGGTFKNELKAATDAVITVSGGIFYVQPNENYVATGYVAKENTPSDGLWTVEASNGMVAEVGEPDNGTVSAEVGGNFSGSENGTTGVDADSSSTVTITATTTPAAGATVSKTEVTINNAALTSVAEESTDSVANVAIVTDVGTVTLDKAAWDTVTANADGDSVVLSVENSSSNIPGWTVTAATTAGDTVFSSEDNPNGTITISVPYTASGETSGTKTIYYINENGDLEAFTAEYAAGNSGTPGTLTWKTGHLSSFVIPNADDEAIWMINGVPANSGSLAEAIAATSSGGTISLLKDITADNNALPDATSAVYVIPNGVNFNGNNHKITAVENWKGDTGTNNHILAVQSDGSSAAQTTIQNVTIIGDPNSKSGIHAYNGAKVVLKNVTIQNCGSVGVQINGATVDATNLNISGSGWGSINVDKGSNVSVKPELTFNSGTLSDTAQIYTELTASDAVTITVDEASGLKQVHSDNSTNLKGFDYYTDDVSKLGVAYNETTNTVYATLEDALTAAVSGDTVTVVEDTTLTTDAEVKSGVTLVVNPDVTLTIPADKTLTNNGAIQNNGTISGTVTPGSGTPVKSTVTISVTPSNATIVVTKNGSTVNGNNGVYLLENGTYSYTVSASGYYTQSGTFTVSGNAQTIPVNLSVIPTDSGSGSSPSGDYLINVDRATGGRVTVTPGRANKGDTVTITVKPNDGYVLDELTVTAKNGGSVKLTWKDDNKYTFTMPGSQVSIQATFVKDSGQTVDLPFADVAESDWYYDAVQYVYENDLMNGTSATTFSPFVTTSRAMILTILARYDGVDTSTGSTWYEAGAVWAIAEGVSDGTNLEANLTREQLVTMLWRYAGSPVVESDLADYPDSASVSDWAVNAMIWAVENGVITGNGAGALNPQGTATRAEVATILMRFIEK